MPPVHATPGEFFIAEPTHHSLTIEQSPFDHEGHRFQVTENERVGVFDTAGNLRHTEDVQGVHFVVEEPTIEHSRPTFHGREEGYMYREHGHEPDRAPVGYFASDPQEGLHHGETFGKHHLEDQFEV